MTPAEAEALLTEWSDITHDRDRRVLIGLRAGLTEWRVFELSGIARSTITQVKKRHRVTVAATCRICRHREHGEERCPVPGCEEVDHDDSEQIVVRRDEPVK